MSAREQFVRDIPEIINVLSDYENEKKIRIAVLQTTFQVKENYGLCKQTRKPKRNYVKCHLESKDITDNCILKNMVSITLIKRYLQMLLFSCSL
ncbi:unnamed protein product [Schistosoma curassoni]|uniref:Uncharacterized protein n=1 Tax=Schistosoma curassoni TaxID=6186 RepID=A0A183JJ41_9TREM|nr:unnamed protein product [Schistosoma curassoni]